MIKFPAPKVPAPQFKGATRSKAARRTAELRKKNFLAHAASSALSAATAALAAPINTPDAQAADGKQLEHKTATELPAYRRVNLGSVSEGQTASVDADGVVTRATNA